MDAQYNVYFVGELLPDHQADDVRSKLGQLFKADDATLDRLFSGTAQLLKRECDKATALKYKQAMERAGARPVIKRVAEKPAATGSPTPAPANRPMTAAERIAAVAAGSDSDTGATQSQGASDSSQQQQDSSGLSIAAAGTDLLKPGERRIMESHEVDTSSLSLEVSGARLSAERPPPPPAPGTEHLSMGEVGETIPTLPRRIETASPDTSSINLSPQGSDFSDCKKPAVPAPELDLSALEVAAEGGDLLEARYRSKSAPEAPDTSHLQLDD